MMMYSEQLRNRTTTMNKPELLDSKMRERPSRSSVTVLIMTILSNKEDVTSVTLSGKTERDVSIVRRTMIESTFATMSSLRSKDALLMTASTIMSFPSTWLPSPFATTFSGENANMGENASFNIRDSFKSTSS